MTTRRTLGAGPDVPAPGIRATQADLHDALPGVRIADLDELRARGVMGNLPPAPPRARRSLGAGQEDTASPDALD
ncbi:hypothetical protein [Streptomyces ortus]|uniref:Aldo/keto reductase n=1 Tax=Streptomyces ortus TaxID=2867268 RepID=A0ABT3UVX2_9ACTN|nr:hypothetical protein [Streptomyces ortus]MCX4231713.1 hypothetical protein [Streptomyces ortus]